MIPFFSSSRCLVVWLSGCLLFLCCFFDVVPLFRSPRVFRLFFRHSSVMFRPFPLLLRSLRAVCYNTDITRYFRPRNHTLHITERIYNTVDTTQPPSPPLDPSSLNNQTNTSPFEKSTPSPLFISSHQESETRRSTKELFYQPPLYACFCTASFLR